jgi:sugar porter (SP) family MFS transporter
LQTAIFASDKGVGAVTNFAREVVRGRNRFVLGISIIAAIGGLLFGYDTGVISGALLYVKQDLHAGQFAQQWIVGSLLLGAVCGAIISGYSADRLSRKWTKFISGCVYVVAALASALAQDVAWLIAARFVLGLAVGTASFVAPMYISEQTPPKIRGGTVSFNQLMVTTGILIAYLINFAFRNVGDNWRWMLGLGAVPGVALAVGMLFVPHTPRWLMQAGREDEARDVLQRSREPDQIDDEVDEMRDVIEQHRGTSLRALVGARVRPLLLVGLALAIFQQLIGVNTVIYYSATILKYTGISTDKSIGEALFVGITNVVFTIVAILLLDRIGRRVLLLIGTVGASAALILLGIYFQSPTLQHSAGWVGLLALLVFIASFAVGLGPVFWLMISEIFPLGIRSKAMSVCTVANWLFNFLVSYFFLSLVSGIGVIALVFFAVRIPETKDRSLEEIEHELGAGASEKEAAHAS